MTHTRIGVAVFVLMGGLTGFLWGQDQPTPPPRLAPCVGGGLPSPFPCDDSMFPDTERRIPPGDYCKNMEVTIRPTETHAHHCDCTYSCSIDEDGNVTDHESVSCQAWCQINGRRCTCWPEGGGPDVICTKPSDGQHNALMDMSGHVVAVR
jgi:hypothetical protein